MTARVMDGEAALAELLADLRERVSRLVAAGAPVPGLATVVVGRDPASQAYVAAKQRDCATVGIRSLPRELSAGVGQEGLLAVVDELNADPTCTGLLVQLPLPPGYAEGEALARIDPAKDVDGLHPVNLGRLLLGEPGPQPCTPRGIVALCRRYGVELDGARVVVVGRGLTVGRGLVPVLSGRSVNATVVACHSGTRDLADEVRRADVVVSAAGVAGLITADMVRPGTTVVDVGITHTELGMVGDVSPEVVEVAALLAPVPGGVGPMTRGMLLYGRVVWGWMS
uniref:bifunctional 5,10-methylenetetrahydrofolate dehydrogenase/5,10-methenyltetrahydrofolate cyclohydrolase n=1 Tax=Pseudonocardia pini TaxID=2758030 RepID=UPI0015F08C6D